MTDFSFVLVWIFPALFGGLTYWAGYSQGKLSGRYSKDRIDRATAVDLLLLALKAGNKTYRDIWKNEQRIRDGMVALFA